MGSGGPRGDHRYPFTNKFDHANVDSFVIWVEIVLMTVDVSVVDGKELRKMEENVSNVEGSPVHIPGTQRRGLLKCFHLYFSQRPGQAFASQVSTRHVLCLSP